jgi:HlyD family secretion protein
MRPDMNQHTLPDTIEIESALGLSPEVKQRRNLRRMIWLAIVAGLLLAGYFLWQRQSAVSAAVTYETTEAKKSDVTITVSATGALQPLTKVDVGTELSGIVREVSVAENDIVKAGQVLARLDVSRLALQRARQQAQLLSSEARLKQATSDFDEAQRQVWRQVELFNGGTGTEEARDAALAAQKRVEPAVAAAKAEVEAARSDLAVVENDLVKGDITSPIDGIILKRSIEPGQTVAASLQAPVLFTIAQDLKRMQLEAAVDEADVGTVKPGQSAQFTVDAYRGKNFPAKIERMSFLPETVDGVVTYKTILSVENPDLILRPGMTATAKIIVAEYRGVIAVPNEAFRYQPPRAQANKGFSITEMFMPRFPRGERARRTAEADGTRKLFVLRNDAPVEVKVKTGESDGKVTIITEGEIKDGDALITAQRVGAAARGGGGGRP